ncbi:FecR family protein [Arenibacter echinorum]|uniref:FecR family protein n=1 Tax=Arenibacter echinorum TaxID=440515 RepID=A0A327R025_9FLAO|nr:FecR family protein [Arenibacter echinorum]RAJ09254.1 FecR family protein [Arenibacter echinorum]
MKPNHSDSLIVKYVNHSITQDELDELVFWLEQPGNKETFQEYVKINYSIDFKLSTYNTEEVKRLLLNKIQKDKRQYRRKRVLSIAKYAAILVIALGVVFLFQKEKLTPPITVPLQTDQTITLELENGRSVILKEEETQDIVSEKGEVIGKQIKQGIQYEDTELSELVYNTLKVPYGKRFQVTLSDGTRVFLNSGSSMKFPVKFIPNADRKVFLSGEAFFEVTKNRDPFIVNAESINVKVLGTQFNVSAYVDDRSMNTVLVEGSVQLLDNNIENATAVLLQPEHEAIWDKVQKQMVVAKADIPSTLAWMNGQLVFRAVPFKDIIKKLERSYNCTIINNNQSLNDEIFSATFNVEKENIEQVINYISKNSPYHFTISENNVITIN